MDSIRPDQGMSRLFPQGADISTQPGLSGPVPAEAPPPPAGPLELMARIAVSLETSAAAADRMTAAAKSGRLKWKECHPILIPPLASAAAGNLQDPDRWGPEAGWAWVITRLTAVLGSGATSMTWYRDAATPVNTILGPVSGGTWEPKRLVLLPGQQLVASSVGGGLTGNGEAAEVTLDALPLLL